MRFTFQRQLPIPEPKKGRVEWTRTAKYMLTDERKGLLVIRLEPEEGRYHAVTGISASYKIRNTGLLTVLSSNRPVRAFFYVHTERDVMFPQPIRGEVGADLVVCLSRGENRVANADEEEMEATRGQPAVAGALTVWGFTTDEET